MMSAETPKPQVTIELDESAMRKLPQVVFGATAAAGVVIAALIVLANKPAWWGGFTPAVVASLLSAAASVFVLRMAVGKPLEKAVAVVYAAAGVRLLASLTACLVAVKIGDYPPKPTGLMICGFYVAVLMAESIFLAKAVNSATVKRE